MREFKFETTSEINGDLTIRLIGDLNESAALPPIGTGNPRAYVRIDFSGLRYINSAGVGIWARWAKREIASYPDVKVEFVGCPKFAIDQINSVVGFCPPNATVHSFYLPFFCEESNESKDALFETLEVRVSGYGDDRRFALREILDSNGKKMEPDVSLAKFFKFL